MSRKVASARASRCSAETRGGGVEEGAKVLDEACGGAAVLLLRSTRGDEADGGG